MRIWQKRTTSIRHVRSLKGLGIFLGVGEGDGGRLSSGFFTHFEIVLS